MNPYVPLVGRSEYSYVYVYANSSSCTTFLIVNLMFYSFQNIVLITVKRYMRDPENLFWSIKSSSEFEINLKLEVSMRPVCRLMIFLLFTRLYLII